MGPGGIKNNGIYHNPITNRGIWGWVFGVVFTSFYCVLYWGYDYSTQSGPLDGMVALVEPVSQLLRGKAADHWFLYTFAYTLLILVMAFRMVMKYRHNRYQILRTISLSFFQLAFAFILPFVLEAFSTQNSQYFISYFWPLDYDAIWPTSISTLYDETILGKFLLFWGLMMSFIAVPVFTYFWGKRWYCSWVCGCGGLAETAGDPFRQLSFKQLSAWKVERYSVHGVLAVIILLTILLWMDGLTADEGGVGILGDFGKQLVEGYGFAIGMVFAGVVGTGFYPIFGSRVWCRFGCPQAAILGLIQRFKSRFRITTNGGQCISCGNCSTYCEMGIDVRWYAQRQQNIVRASCVGCGICSAVCPRGVLRLENGSDTPGRSSIQPIHISRNEAKIL